MPSNLKNSNQKIDIYIIILLALNYVMAYIIKFVFVGDDLVFVIMLNVLYLFVIIAYFSSVVTSLISCAVFVLLYGSYIFYRILIVNETVTASYFYWLAIIPVNCIVISYYRTFLMNIQENIMQLQNSVEYLTFLNGSNNLFNDRMFYYELKREMAMAKRGYIKLCIMLIKIKYYDEILRLVGKAAINDIFVDINTTIDDVTRIEDVPFLLDEKGTFSLILVTDTAGAQIIKDRIKSKIKQVNLQEKLKSYNLVLELKIGIAEYRAELQNEFEFKQMAEANMEFDV